MQKLNSLLTEYKFRNAQEVIDIQEYFNLVKEDKSYCLSPADRLLKAIGEPELIDTSKVPELGRKFGNRIIKRYAPFKDFFGLEEVIEKIVSFLKHAAQGLEERKQILYLLGSPGGGKSSLAEKLKELMEQEPFYAIEGSPIHESPLGLARLFPSLKEELGIEEKNIPYCISPWLQKRIDELDSDISQLKVVKMHPSRYRQIAISKTEPGDENTQDISALVGKLDIRKLEHFAQDDPDAYRYNGGLCIGNRGILEFVEMFKAPIKILNPLLTATQEGNYKATEQMPAIPFEGIILSHSNFAEWDTFVANRNNEAFLDRIYTIKVPYALSISDEQNIYNKYIQSSSLKSAPVAPHTLETLAKFSVLTRLEELGETNPTVKMLVYDGKNVKDQFPNAKSYQEYKDRSSSKEGFFGLSTRTAFKVLSKVFNYDVYELAANPVHLFSVLKNTIETDDLSKETKDSWNTYINEYVLPEYIKLLQKDIQVAYLDSYADYAQHLFDAYISHADAWLEDQDYRDPNTGQIYDRAQLNFLLEELEKPARIANPKDFRHEVVNFNLRYQATHKGKNIPWHSHDRFKAVIEAKLFTKTEDLLPQISFDGHAKNEEAKKHKAFLERMKEKGYTERQVRLVVEFFQRYTKSK
jgi:serine protein kinase